MKNFIFIENDWKTPNTYGENFAYPQNQSGVYLLVERLIKDKHIEFKILYVGSSKNLYQRYKSHEVLRVLKETYGDVAFYFRYFKKFKEIEKKLIKIIQPRFNKQCL